MYINTVYTYYIILHRTYNTLYIIIYIYHIITGCVTTCAGSLPRSWVQLLTPPVPESHHRQEQLGGHGGPSLWRRMELDTPKNEKT